MRKLIIIFLFSPGFCISALKAQISYQEVDSISYRLYEEKKWEELSYYGEAVSTEKFDSYYLNLRFGIANYELEQYNKSLLYFEKAYKNNSSEDILKEYLYWNYTYLYILDKAAEIYKLLPEIKKKEINRTSRKLLDYIYLEGGQKFISKSNEGLDMLYINLGMNHQIGKRLSVYHAYTYLENDLPWQQQEYYFSPKFTFGKNVIELNLHGSINKEDVNYVEDYLYQSNNLTPDSGYKTDTTNFYSYTELGNTNTLSLYSGINFSRKIKNFTLTPHFGVYIEQYQPNYTSTTVDSTYFSYQFNDVEIFNSSSSSRISLDNTGITNNQLFQGGLSASYEVKGLHLAVDYSLIQTDSNQVYHYFIPSLRYNYKKTGITINYLYKGDHSMSFVNGSLLYNHNYPMEIYTATISQKIYKRTEVFLTYQKENLTFTPEFTQKKHTLLIGLKIKL